MDNRVSNEWSLFAIYTLLCSVYGIALVALHWLSQVSWTDELLALMVIPIFHVAFSCRCRVYVPMIGIVIVISIFVISCVVSHIISSLVTIAITLCMISAASEMVYRAMQKHRISQEELLEARKFLEAAVAQSPSGILIADAPDVTIRMANPAAFGIRGETDRPLTNIEVEQHASNWQTFRPDGAPYPPEELPLSRAVLKGEITRNEEVIIRDEFGADHWVSANAAPIRDSEGCITAGIVIFHDITERKKNEVALRDSEMLYRTLIENLQQSVFLKDIDLRFISANRSFCDLLGFASEEIEGKTDYDFFPKELADKYRADDQRVLETGRPLTLTEENIVGNTKRWVEVVKTPVQDADGMTKGILGIFWDITTRKQAEEELRESEFRMRAIVEGSPFGAFVYELESNDDLLLASANSSANRILGVDCQQFVGKTIEEAFPALTHTEIPTAYRHVAATGESFSQDVVDYDEQGIKGSYEIHAFQIGTNRMTVLFRDITERKQAEEALRNEKKFTETALNSQQDTFFLFEPATGKAIRWNRAFNDISGYTDEDIRRMRAPDSYYSPGDLERAASFTKDVLESGIGTIELELLCKDGHKVPTEYNVSVIKDEKNLSKYLISIGRDITDRKRAEIALRESEENLRTTLNSIGDAVIVTNTQGIIIRMNPVAEKLTGWPQRESMGKPLVDVFHIVNAQTGKEADNPVEKVLQTGKIIGLANHTKLISRNGDQYQIADSAAPIMDDEGNTTGIVLVFRDVTDEYQMQSALQERERFLKNVFQSLQDGVSVLDRNLTIVQTNKWMEEMYAHEAPLGGKKCYTAYQQRETVCPWCPTVEAMETGETRRVEVPYPNIKNVKGWIDLSAFPLKNEGGEVTGVIEYVKDISERKRAENALQKSEQMYREAIEVAGAVPYYQNYQTNTYNFIGNEIKALTGYAPEEFTYDLWQSLEQEIVLLGALEGCSPDELAQQARNGEDVHWRADYRIKTKTGEERWLANAAIQVKNEQGQVVGSLGILQDITERKHAEEELRKSEERYRNFIINASEGIYRIDFTTPISIDLTDEELIESISSHAVIGEVNEALARMYGLHSVDMVGRPATEYAPEYGKRAILAVRAPNYRIRDVETEDVDKDGQPLYLLESYSAFIKDGMLIRIWGMQRDITERKRLEEQLRQAQKMEAVGQLAGGVAHDFNNILTAVIGNLNLAEYSASGEIRPFLEKAKIASDRAAGLVKQLLAFSRKTGVDLKLVNVNDIVAEVYDLARHTIDRRIEIAVHTSKDLPLVNVDSAQINSVLMNLCINARDTINDVLSGKAFPERQDDHFVISIETKSTIVQKEYCDIYPYARPGRYIVISVTDNGTGIEEEIQRHVFEPFYSTKEVGQGSGLGLASSYGIIKQHGGWINLYSEPREGTTFKIYLPIAQAEAPKESPQRVEKNFRGAETILLVDDEPMVREPGKMILESYGYTVLAATNGKEALELFQKEQERIDLILLDLSMPLMSGREVLERLRAMHSNVKVIVCSGYAENDQRGYLGKLGVINYVSKPYSPSDLARVVRSALDMNTHYS